MTVAILSIMLEKLIPGELLGSSIIALLMVTALAALVVIWYMGLM